MITSQQPDETELRRMHREVLRPTFPEGELVTEDDFVRAVASGAAHCAWESDEQGPTGVAVAEFFPRSRVLLVAWLAVRPGVRGGGLGRRLLARALELWEEELHPVLVVGEVEHPTYQPETPDHGDPRARLRFYNSFGVRALPVPYVMPPLREGMAPLHHLMLVAFREEGELPGSTVATAPVRAFLEDYLPSREAPYDRAFAALEPETLPTIALTVDPAELPNAPRADQDDPEAATSEAPTSDVVQPDAGRPDATRTGGLQAGGPDEDAAARG